MGKVSKGVSCSVEGCTNNAIRSIDAAKVRKVGLEVSASKRAYLCNEHYKLWKKEIKHNKTNDDISLRYR